MNQNACNFYIVQRLQTLHPGQGGHHTNFTCILIDCSMIHSLQQHSSFLLKNFSFPSSPFFPLFVNGLHHNLPATAIKSNGDDETNPPFCCIPSTITLVTKPNNN